MARRSRAAEETPLTNEPPPAQEAPQKPAPTAAPTQRARRTRAVTTSEAPAAAAESTAPTPIRRRRRRVVDPVAQNALLTAAILKARGPIGASLDDIMKITTWARSVNVETAEVAALAKRQRVRRGEMSAERIAVAELNQHLLSGVLAGKYSVDVDNTGRLIFNG